MIETVVWDARIGVDPAPPLGDAGCPRFAAAVERRLLEHRPDVLAASAAHLGAGRESTVRFRRPRGGPMAVDAGPRAGVNRAVKRMVVAESGPRIDPATAADLVDVVAPAYQRQQAAG